MSARSVAVACVFIAAFCAPALAQAPRLPARDLPLERSTTGAGSIAGVVQAADTGMPLRGVDIRLTGTGLPGGARGAFTDAGGRYEFVGLPDGQYTLIASKVRYMTMTYGQTRAGEEGRSVQVAGGQRVENIDFILPAGAVIVLRVGNRFGDPAVGYQVALFEAKFNAGQRALASVGDPGFPNITDDRGEIRLSGLHPGEYYVSAQPALAPPSQAVQERESQTFYPGTASEADAQPITVRLGEEVVFGFDTVVASDSRISGTIVGTARAEQVSLERLAVSGATLLDFNIGSGDSFSRANLPSGEYRVTARNQKEMGTLLVQVAGEDISDLVITMTPALPIRGRLAFEGAAPPGVAPAAFQLRPAFAGRGAMPFVAQYKPDWTFEIPALPGSGVLRSELPRGWFLKSVLLDGRDVTDTVLDFDSYQGRSLEVTVTQTATEVSGRVADAAGRDVTNYVAVAFAEDPQRWTPLTRAIVSARPDQQGRFSIRGLPPGRYLVAAVDFLQPGQEREPKTLERLRAGATAVALTEGATQSVTVPLSPSAVQ